MKFLAIDLGLKRIGVAYCVHKDMVTPLPAILRKNRNQAASEVQKLIKEWDIDAIVVGLPLGGTSEDEMRRRIKHFMNLVDFKKEIFYEDEAGSSLEAEALIKGETKHVRDGRIDSIAAMIIMQRFILKNKKLFV